MNLPKAKKYILSYQKEKEVKNYIVSNPIDETKDSITVYAIGSGVRSFKRSKIISINICGATVKL